MQVTQDIFRMKQGDSQKEQVPKYFAGAPSDYKMAEVPVQEDSTIVDTTINSIVVAPTYLSSRPPCYITNNTKVGASTMDTYVISILPV
jgi:hypothetical protein